MTFSASFGGVLKALTHAKNKSDRLSLTLLLGNLSRQLTEDLIANCRSLQENRERAEAHLSLVLTLRTLWSLIPERLFTGADPDFERLARTSLEALNEGISDDRMVHSLSVVYRRLRSDQLEGRRVSSLSLSRPAHRKLLDEQDGCCALCRYRFAEYQLIYAENDVEDELFDERRTPKDGEIVLNRYDRRPVLDHIVPQFLGGDGPENWQILCQSCNAGKGDGLTWIMRRGLMPPSRPSDARVVTPSLRFALISHHHSTSKVREVPPRDTGELRLYRRNPDRLPVFDNLEVRVSYTTP
jgi:5-methylcytosine-specific restriction endonuclease McrA